MIIDIKANVGSLVNICFSVMERALGRQGPAPEGHRTGFVGERTSVVRITPDIATLQPWSFHCTPSSSLCLWSLSLCLSLSLCGTKAASLRQDKGRMAGATHHLQDCLTENSFCPQDTVRGRGWLDVPAPSRLGHKLSWCVLWATRTE